MTHLILHSLPGQKRAGKLAQTIEELYANDRRLLVWVADEGRRHVLDDYLWTFRKLSFIPHAIWENGADRPPEPVVLIGEPVDLLGSEVLVVGDDLPPIEWAKRFEEIHDCIPAGEAGEMRIELWREAGLVPSVTL